MCVVSVELSRGYIGLGSLGTRSEIAAELIRLGAYKQGTDPELDRAIRLNGALEAFMTQDRSEASEIGTSFADLERVLKTGQSGGSSR